jgi:HAD superfamily hydrolase (TIGR01459 family)
MTRLIPSLAEISASYDVLFCDLWGCIHDGLVLFPDAVAALLAFRARGGRVVLMTNAPRTHRAVIRRLDRMGLPRDAWDLVVSSGDATQEAMLHGAAGRQVWHLGPDMDEDIFTEIPSELAHLPPVTRVPLDTAEGIVCTGLFDDRTETPEAYRAPFLAAKTRGLILLNANPDLVVDVGEVRIPCAGALAALYAQMGGQTMAFGKPHPPIYDLARRKLASAGIDASNDRVLVLGDGILTDLPGARGEGIDAVFVTGGLEAARFGPDPANPDPALLEAFLAERGLDPAYAIGLLR